MDIPFDVCLSHVQMEEKPYTRPTRSTHSSCSSTSSASRTPSTSSSVTIRTPTSDSESTAPSSLQTFTSTPRPKMESTSRSVGNLYQDRDDNPAAKSTYLILHQPTNLALTLVGGWFALHKVPVVLGEGHPLEGKCSWHWQCVETDGDGWLGFRNAASGRHLGLDGEGKKDADSGLLSGGYRVANGIHGEWERLMCVRAGGDGEHEEGYILCSLQISAAPKTIPRLVKARLKPLGSGSDSEEGWKDGSKVSMVWQDGQEGTVWRFVKV